MDILKSLDIPTAIAAILVLTRWYLDDRRKDRELWKNHLSDSVKQQTRTAELLERLVNEVRTLSDRLR